MKITIITEGGNILSSIDYEKELQLLEEKKKVLLKEKRAKEKEELKVLQHVFGSDYPKK